MPDRAALLDVGTPCRCSWPASAGRRRADDQVFRWGDDDEFAVLLPATGADAAAQVFARLEAAVSSAVRDPDGRAVRISFGWAAAGPETDLRTLTERADAGLLARKAGRPRRAAA